MFEDEAAEFFETGIFPTGCAEKDFRIFCHFVYENELDTLKILQKDVRDIDFRRAQFKNKPRNFRTPLDLAVGRGHHEIAEFFLIKGANPNMGNFLGNPLLHHTIWEKQHEMTKLLLKFDADAKLQDHCGRTPLGIACWSGNYKAASILLKSGSSTNEICGSHESYKTPLFSACLLFFEHQNLDLITLLLQNKADARFVNSNGNSALFYSKSCQVDELLLKHGTELNHRNKERQTALYKAVENQEVDRIEKFLESGMKIKIRDTLGRSALHHAVVCRKVESLKAILKNRDIDINNHVDNQDKSPLHLLVMEDTPVEVFDRTCNEILDVLLSYGTKIGPPIASFQAFIPAKAVSDRPGGYHYDKLVLLGYEVKKNFLTEVLDRCCKRNRDEDFEQFNSELERLKKVKVSDGKTNLYDVLFFDCKMMVRNSGVLQKLVRNYGGDFERKFPHYGMILNYRVRRGFTRSKLIESAVDTMKLVVDIGVPRECKRMIFGHLSESQLKEFSGHDWDFLKLSEVTEIYAE